MPTKTDTSGDTDPSMTAVKLPVVTADGEREAPVPEPNPWELADYMGPDVWDANGRLISNDRNNPI